MKKYLRVAAVVIVLLAALVYSSCRKEEKTVVPAPPGNEFLTTCIFSGVNKSDTSDHFSAHLVDLTPDDTVGPTRIDTIKLKAGASYTCTVGILDETKTPAADVGAEIYERRNYHLICFTITGLSSGFTVTRTDLDSNNPPLQIGLKDDVTAGAVGTGSLEIQLKHQPNLKNGSCDPGSVDFDVTYPVIVH